MQLCVYMNEWSMSVLRLWINCHALLWCDRMVLCVARAPILGVYSSSLAFNFRLNVRVRQLFTANPVPALSSINVCGTVPFNVGLHCVCYSQVSA